MAHFEGCSFKPELPSGASLSGDRLLLHCCCAPCSTAILEWLVDEGLQPGLFFSNSNIVPFPEYGKRRDELVRFASAHGLEVFDDEYDHSAWLVFVRADLSVAESNEGAVRALLTGPERGPRCLVCFKFRLLRAALFARSHGYTLLTTTLASSRWKDLNQVDQAGRWAVEQALMGSGGTGVREASDEVPNLKWWGQNWRKGGLQNRRSELIKSCGLYNQSWCGCEFSKR